MMLVLSVAEAMGQANSVPAGQSTNLGVIPIPGATYAWDLYINDVAVNFATVPGNCPATDAYFTAGNTSPTVEVTWVTPVTYFFRVIVTAPDGCMNLKMGQMEVIDCPAPVVTFSPCFDVVTSVEARPFRLKGGLPLNGVYSGGPWVNNPAQGMFNPQAAPEGQITVTYTYTDAQGCSASAQGIIQNNPAPAGFTCGMPWTDIRDNKTYPTLLIDGVCWMGSNLNYGTSVPMSLPQTDNCVTERYCYNNDPVHCNGPGAAGLQDGPGGAYQWDEMMQYSTIPGTQDICPPGWHVPTEPEWAQLFTALGGNALAGAELQDPASPGFRVLPSGVVYQNEIWSFKDLATILWSSTPIVPGKAISHGMNIKDPSVSYYESSKVHAFPVRCVKN
jgi:uncharacterized protein (TIGR02145 family)